jgi:mannose-6-phosphate isomerase-like protein (cupin superfamily)
VLRVGVGLREERLTFGEVNVVIRVSAEDSGGAMAVIEEVPPMVDTPLHVHSREDELFYIVEGEHVITLGDEEHRLGPGDALAQAERDGTLGPDAYATASERAGITWL